MNRNKRIFDGSQAIGGAVRGHPHLAREIATRTVDGAPCVVVSSYRALIRVVGFFMYNSETPVLLRGQRRCYRNIRASLHRRTTPPTDADVDGFLKRYRAALGVDPSKADQLSTEPLLQHYGLDTRWIDVVDSVPHALFFATHVLAQSQAKPGTWTYIHSREQFGFVYVIDTGQVRPVRSGGKALAGFGRGSTGLLVADLRKLKPSLALRPHAQHGLLIRDTTGNPDIWDRIVCRVAVPTMLARRWIAASAFEPDELFPPKAWDGVFGHLISPKMEALLHSEEAAGNNWGQVQRFDFHAK